MNIREIKVGELPGFIKSEEYSKLNIKAITDLRAISQFNNPDAKPEDPALIYAADNEELLGFAGLLPRYINGEKIRIFSNSCWWVHPQKGRTIALPLFYKLIERAGFSLYLSESPPHVKSILEKTGLFGPLEQNKGIRGFIRFYFADILTKRYPNFKRFSFVVAPFDFLLNSLTATVRFFFLIKFERYSFKIESVSEIDEKTEEFIQRHSKTELIQKTPESFKWFREFPWIKEKNKNDSVVYPFTYQVKKFELHYFVLKKENEIKAFFAVSNRDNICKIPYIYFDTEDIREVVSSVMKLILLKKYDSLVVFHPEIVEYMKQQKMPFYLRKTEIKYSGTTKQIYNYFEQKPLLQDGDGDVVFV